MIRRKPLVVIDGEVAQLPSSEKLQGDTFSYTTVENIEVEIAEGQQMVSEFLEVEPDGNLLIEGSLYLLGV